VVRSDCAGRVLVRRDPVAPFDERGAGPLSPKADERRVIAFHISNRTSTPGLLSMLSRPTRVLRRGTGFI